MEASYMSQVIVIDGMGGGIGSQIISQLQPAIDAHGKVEVVALGTNSAATTSMVKAGAQRGATGENAICYCAGRADIIIGPLGIIIPHSMLGEITPAMAAAVVASKAKKFLLPINQPHVELIGISAVPLATLLKELVRRVQAEWKMGN
jgi:hypothetical protein